MTEPYTYRSPDTDTLTPRPAGVPGDVVLSARNHNGDGPDAYVRADFLDELVQALYRAAGRDVVVLDRWEYDKDGSGVLATGIGHFTVADHGKVRWSWVDDESKTIDTSAVRKIAGALVLLAERADAEPDADSVENLRQIVVRTLKDSDDPVRIARDVLAAGYGRGEAQDG